MMDLWSGLFVICICGLLFGSEDAKGLSGFCLIILVAIYVLVALAKLVMG